MKVTPKIELVEVENEGLFALMGKQVEIGCNVYIYTGILVGVNDTCIKLEDAAIVYETGELTASTYKDAQRFYTDSKVPRYIPLSLMENFGQSFKKY